MKKYLIYVMGLLYLCAGINHFVNPGFYLKMLEGFLPYPDALNAVSGAAEVVLGVAVMVPAYRRWAAWGIVLLLIAVFPANINMALNPAEWDMPLWGLYLRLPVQFVLIWWAYIYTKQSDKA